MWGTNKATFDDSIQGYLGDCWLVASSTSLFNDASRLDDIFLVKEINEVGVYAFKFHLLGMPITVTIDDYVPFDVDYPDYLLFGQPSEDHALAFPLLEKAMAKYLGNYEAINGGMEFDAFSTILGVPVVIYDT